MPAKKQGRHKVRGGTNGARCCVLLAAASAFFPAWMDGWREGEKRGRTRTHMEEHMFFLPFVAIRAWGQSKGSHAFGNTCEEEKRDRCSDTCTSKTTSFAFVYLFWADSFDSHFILTAKSSSKSVYVCCLCCCLWVCVWPVKLFATDEFSRFKMHCNCLQ